MNFEDAPPFLFWRKFLFEKTKEYIMGRVDKPEVKDWLILGGLVLAIAIVAFDIIAVRGRNKMLKDDFQRMTKQSEFQLKTLEEKTSIATAGMEQKIKNLEEKVSEFKRKINEQTADYDNKTDSLISAHQKELKEQKESYEQQIQKMITDFNEKISESRGKQGTAPVTVAKEESSTKKVQRERRCNRCSGHGSIKVKEKCATCKGHGRIEKDGPERHRCERRLNGHWHSEWRKTVVRVDCPDCLPGAFKGGGSKGYTIESKPCPNCGGDGKVPRN